MSEVLQIGAIVYGALIMCGAVAFAAWALAGYDVRRAFKRLHRQR